MWSLSLASSEKSAYRIEWFYILVSLFCYNIQYFNFSSQLPGTWPAFRGISFCWFYSMLSLRICHLSLFSFNSFMLLSVDSSSVRFQVLCGFSLKTRVCCPQSLGCWRMRSYWPLPTSKHAFHFWVFLYPFSRLLASFNTCIKNLASRIEHRRYRETMSKNFEANRKLLAPEREWQMHIWGQHRPCPVEVEAMKVRREASQICTSYRFRPRANGFGVNLDRIWSH